MDLDSNAALRRALLGTRSSPRRSGAAVAAGLFGVTGLFAFASHAAFDAIPEAVLLPFVLLGGLLAVGAAYAGSGLLVSTALVVGPVYGPVTFYAWLISTREAAPVAFVLSFYGHGAPALWAPIAVVLAAGSYAIGALARRFGDRLGLR
ncbi:hypothetical protein ACFQMF_09910 [Halorubrum rutilum]|uniref:Uncharacterized protein n=1 Tax=Halorubrum rutilum TaxID=1364933 RepID=A0ABD6AKS6_9EURY|nr:hypothetical protein [Halorubrum rutilum]